MAGERVLVVDDNSINRKLLRLLLVDDGYQVDLAGDADEAMAAIARDRPALILMDVKLPGIDGLELTRRLKAAPATRAIAVIAVTAQALPEDEARALAAGCDGYLAKPIDVPRLEALVARWCGRGQR